MRRFTPDDVDLATALDADPAVMICDVYLLSWIEYHEAGDRYGFWAAIEKPTGAFLGRFHLRAREGDPDDEPELGYLLVALSWGVGTRRRADGRCQGGHRPSVVAQ